MKKTSSIFITAVALIGAASSSFAEPTKKPVLLKTTDGKIITIASMGGLDFGKSENPSKQTFTLVDANGGDLADGDEVQVVYNPGGGGKPSYWKVTEGKVSRYGGKGDTFKLKKVEDKYVFQTSDGKFVAAAPSGGKGLVVADSQDGALKLEIADAPEPSSSPAATSDKPAADKPASDKPAAAAGKADKSDAD